MYRPGAVWPTAIKAWFNEVKTYEFNTELNHYTQVKQSLKYISKSILISFRWYVYEVFCIFN